jgi:hypothetical protein
MPTTSRTATAGAVAAACLAVAPPAAQAWVKSVKAAGDPLTTWTLTASKTSPPTRIAGRIRLVTVSVRFLGGRRVDLRPVRAHAVITQIISAVNQLPPLGPGAYSCPADRGPNVILRLFGATGSRPVATVNADNSGCGLVKVTIRGRPRPAAREGWRLIMRLVALRVLPRWVGRARA